MLVKLFKYCHGYVRIKVSGFSPERFINLCGNRNILLWQVKRCHDSYEMYLSAAHFLCIGPILRKTKTRAMILEKYGLPFTVHKYKKRKLFPIGILFCAVFLFTMSLFLWEIKIEGNLYRTDDVIEDYLEEMKIVPGMFKSSISCELIEKGLREEFDDITWTSAKIQGTCLEIQIKENGLPKEAETISPACDLVAEKDGKIVAMITRSGVPMCRKDMDVTKGTILVSGAIPIKDDGGNITDYQYVAADADIRMKTIYYYQDEFALRDLYKEYTGQERKNYYIATAEKIMYLPILRQHFRLYDSYIEEFRFPIYKDVRLPVCIGIGHQREYYEASRKYDQDTARNIAEERVQKYCEKLIEKGVQIITNSVKIDFVGNLCRASGKIYVIESVGSKHTISVMTEDTK